jgi:uncharacterized protein YegJ (DUF2314 family)
MTHGRSALVRGRGALSLTWLGVVVASAAGAAPAPPDRPYQITREGKAKWQEQLAPLIQKARATYPEARDRYLRGLPRGQRFFVKYELPDEARGVTEQVFIRVDRVANGIITGRIASDLDLVRNHRQGDTVTFPEGDIVDWMIARPDGSEEGNLIGKYIDTLNAPQAPVPAPAPAPARSPAGPPATALPVPAELRVAVERASHLGRVIYLQYRAMTLASEALLDDERSHDQIPLGGALAVLDPSRPGEPTSFTVSFFSREGVPRVASRVHVTFKAGAKPTVEDVRPPATPGPELAALYRARQAALGVGAREQLIDTLVLPPSRDTREDAILVYLIAGTKKPDVAVLGRHFRVIVSHDGRSVMHFEPLSKAILELPLGPTGGDLPAGARPVSLAVTHLVSDTPLETHVFASLRYGVAIIVATPTATWRVDRDKIEYLGAR